jgi:hypothetical protein
MRQVEGAMREAHDDTSAAPTPRTIAWIEGDIVKRGRIEVAEQHLREFA